MSPTSVKDVKEIILSSSKNILGKVLSPSKDKLTQKDSIKKVDKVEKPEKTEKVENKKPILMTRREWTDPFGSDDEDETMEISANENNAETKISNDNNINDKQDIDNKISDIKDVKEITSLPNQVIFIY